ncbi:putative lipoprotein [Pseudomonas ficuserectae]|uniref:Lipoprotein n=14 Tax=Pseudomonas syringae group TaxID=136849 RepID=A0A0N8T131_PSEAJ|nr:lipoprotein, putative [Pseudomonas savastanoi pv. phaseolicola 1448A]EFW78152.1 putative lipoprotein [Pseudomonas savastanoi pv. glycinea str. B076]EFW86817.1 putative lipoprotein [Pseudomonas savastanoi pv. glycinea str. race 4]EGH00433.1 putative lipoprotein [Pseudomonas amygdali pv. aesculi str. 0893_23]EGH20086.1 putative lipoprotein [Pseudomonas amygdali pv. mori str. 301020]KPW42994.1 putative lipoprotein [Pseudomonas amygdali]KPW44319.1 putative lipoprotein [Pseudomonas syringae pv.
MSFKPQANGSALIACDHDFLQLQACNLKLP